MIKAMKLLTVAFLTLTAIMVAQSGQSSPAFAWCSALTGTDSALEYGYPSWLYRGWDNPGDDHGSYAPDANWHDLFFRDCYGSPGGEVWSDEQYIRWGAAEEDKLNRENAFRTIVHEVRVHPLDDYNNNGAASTTLPIVGVDNGTWWEELRDGYREVEFHIWEPRLINAYVNYLAAVKWDRLDNNVYSEIYGESEYCDNTWYPVAYDEIGWAHVEFIQT